MKCTIVRYGKCFNLGNFEHEKIAVEVAIDDGESPQEAITQARKHVEMQSASFRRKIVAAEEIVNHSKDHTGRQVEEAEKFLDGLTATAVPRIASMSDQPTGAKIGLEDLPF